MRELFNPAKRAMTYCLMITALIFVGCGPASEPAAARAETATQTPVIYYAIDPITVTGGGSLETEITVYFEEIDNGYMNVSLYFLDREGKALGGAAVPSLTSRQVEWITHSRSTPIPAGAVTANIQLQWKARGAFSGILYCESIRVRQAGEGAEFASLGLRGQEGPLDQTTGPEGRRSWRLAATTESPTD